MNEKDKRQEQTILTCEPLFDGAFLHAQKLTVRLENGKMALREVVRHKAAVVIVPIWQDGTISLVRQFRAPLAKEILEVPAGLLEEGEDPLEAAKRELKEETGIEAQNWHYLTAIASSPGFCDEMLWLYAATGLCEGETHFDEDEYLAEQRVPMNEVYEMIMRGEICDASTVSAVLMTMDKMRNGDIHL